MYCVSSQLDALKPKRVRRIKSRNLGVEESDLSDKNDTRTDVIMNGPTSNELLEMGLSSNIQKKGNKFIIQRLIPGLSKSGFHFHTEDFEPDFVRDWNPAIENRRADWRFGSMLLLVDGLKTDQVQGVRNMKGEKKTICGRLLQHIHRPWALPTTIPFDDNGVPFKIVYPKYDINKAKGGGRTFEAGEPLWVLTLPGADPDVMLPVIDFEGYRGEIYIRDVHFGVDEKPWGILVNCKWMIDTIEVFNKESRRWAELGFIQRIIKQGDPPSRKLAPTPRLVRKRKLNDKPSDTITIPGNKLKIVMKRRATKRKIEENSKGEEELELQSRIADPISGVRGLSTDALNGDVFRARSSETGLFCEERESAQSFSTDELNSSELSTDVDTMLAVANVEGTAV